MVTFSILYDVCLLEKFPYNYQYSLNRQEFYRQGDSNTVDQHKLPVPVTARYLRFNPTQRHAWNCLRVEVYGTERGLLPLYFLAEPCQVFNLDFSWRCHNTLWYLLK